MRMPGAAVITRPVFGSMFPAAMSRSTTLTTGSPPPSELPLIFIGVPCPDVFVGLIGSICPNATVAADIEDVVGVGECWSPIDRDHELRRLLRQSEQIHDQST